MRDENNANVKYATNMKAAWNVKLLGFNEKHFNNTISTPLKCLLTQEPCVQLISGPGS
jgi:hypothetical protein